MNKLVATIFFSLVITMSSCAYILRPRGMAHTYSGRHSGLDTLINIEGYYIIYHTQERRSRYRGLMFYKDGSIQFQIGNFYASEEDYVESVVTNPKAQKIGNTTWGEWGAYKLLNDSIIEVTSSLWYDKVSRMESTTSLFKIIDKNHIKQIDGWHHSDDLFVFRPYPNRIDSTNWLLHRGWFWEKGMKK